MAIAPINPPGPGTSGAIPARPLAPYSMSTHNAKAGSKYSSQRYWPWISSWIQPPILVFLRGSFPPPFFASSGVLFYRNLKNGYRCFGVRLSRLGWAHFLSLGHGTVYGAVRFWRGASSLNVSPLLDMDMHIPRLFSCLAFYILFIQSCLRNILLIRYETSEGTKLGTDGSGCDGLAVWARICKAGGNGWVFVRFSIPRWRRRFCSRSSFSPVI